MNIINPKNFILAVVASFAVTIGLAYVFHGMVMHSFYQEKYQHEVIFTHSHFILLGYGLLCALMSFIYPYLYRGGIPLVEGIKFGVMIGFLWRGLYLLVEYGYGIIDSDLVITDGAWHILEQGVTGIIIALVYGKSVMLKNN